MNTNQSTIPNNFTRSLGTRYPIIMAPMFLVSNEQMMIAGMREGILSVFPTLNFRDEGQLERVVDACNSFNNSEVNKGTFGVNLIVQKSNPYFTKHLRICADKKVPFYITSLGSPQAVIEAAHSYGAKVFCDVTNLKYAEKVIELGCDGLIAVAQGAGGHAGSNALQVLVPALRALYPETMLVAAGGITGGAGLLSSIALGADAVSVGTRFIASTEATVSDNYKQAILDYGMDNIVLTDKISGTPCTVIQTPYVKSVGTHQNWLERILNRNKKTRRLFKTLTQLRGMRKLERAAFSATYKTMWCAGQSIQLIDEVLPVASIVKRFVNEYTNAYHKLPKPDSVNEPESQS